VEDYRPTIDRHHPILVNEIFIMKYISILFTLSASNSPELAIDLVCPSWRLELAQRCFRSFISIY